jgi:hypothetical protein
MPIVMDGTDSIGDLGDALAAKLDSASYKPGLSYITSATAAAASSISINNCFTAAYVNYWIVVDLTAASGTNQNMLLRMRAGGADNSAAEYNQLRIEANASSVTPYENPAGNTVWQIGLVDTARASSFGAVMDIQRPQQAQPTLMHERAVYANNASAGYHVINACHHVSTTAFDGLTVYVASGTITGRCTVYGYATS